MRKNKSYNTNDISDKHLDEMIIKLINKNPPYVFRVKEQKTEKRYIMLRKKILKYGVTGLCIAAVLSASVFYGQINNLFSSESNTATTVAKSSNSFIMTVNAAEITKDSTPAFSATTGAASVGLSMGFDGSITPNSKIYCAPFDIDIKGENIDTVTYSIKNAAFELTYRTGNPAFIKGTEDKLISSSDFSQGAPIPEEFCEELHKVNTLEEVERIIVLNKLYSSFTYDYNKEKQEKIYMYIAGNSRFLSKENQKMVNSCDEYLTTKHTPQQIKPVFDGLVNSVEIDCTVKFKDGTTDAKTIKAGTTIMTQEEAFNGTDIIVGEKYKKTKDVFITFAIKE